MNVFQSMSALSGANLWERLQIWYDQSVLRDLAEWFRSLFDMEFGSYEHFTVTNAAGQTVRNVIIGLMLGMILASAMAIYTRTVQGKFIRTLLRRECFTPERAVTLHEAGMFCNLSVRRDLCGRGALYKVTRCVEEEAFDARVAAGDPEAVAAAAKAVYVPDLTEARFYIPEELKYRAELRYDRRGFGWLPLLAVLVIGIAAILLLCRYLPALLGLADWILGLWR